MAGRTEIIVVEHFLPHVRFDTFLRSRFPAISRGTFQRLLEEGHIRVTRASGRAEVELKGNIDERAAQRIRNVIGSVPLARLINAR